MRVFPCHLLSQYPLSCLLYTSQVHPQLFIMEVDRKRGRTARQSYQYVDVLTGMVRCV